REFAPACGGQTDRLGHAAQPRSRLACRLIMAGDHGGSHMMRTLTSSMPGVPHRTRWMESSMYTLSGHPGVVSVIVTTAIRSLLTRTSYTSPKSTILIPTSGSMTCRSNPATVAASTTSSSQDITSDGGDSANRDGSPKSSSPDANARFKDHMNRRTHIHCDHARHHS